MKEIDIDTLIDRHRDSIVRRCMRAAHGNETACAEMVQECYLALWRRLGSLRVGAGERQERNWVMWQCRSAISHWRRHRHGGNTVSLDEVSPDMLVAPSDFAYREIYETMAARLMPDECRFLSLMVEGYTTDEIAARMSLPGEKAKSMRRRLLAQLRKIYFDEIINQ